QKWITAGLCTLFAALILSYSFCHRFSPEKVTQMIPSAFGDNAVQAASLEELMIPSEYAALPGAEYFVKTLLPLVDEEYTSLSSQIAWAPLYRTYRGQSSFIAVCWIGGRSPWLRWKFEQASDKKISPLKNQTVWPTWQCFRNDLPEGKNLYVALTENLFLVCLSETEMDIVSVLDYFDKNKSARNT
ncbi:MAG: hypothetical protein JXR23_10685, partial [Pontiellaceae bacterium]|nr:hypothetical protein [Pontiellaceae bacterium]